MRVYGGRSTGRYRETRALQKLQGLKVRSRVSPDLIRTNILVLKAQMELTAAGRWQTTDSISSAHAPRTWQQR